MSRKVLFLVALLCTGVFSQPNAQGLEAVRYTLRFPAPHTHYVEIEAAIPTGGRPQIEVYMATWTPGSYLVREYSRHVEDVRAEAGGQPRAVEKTAKNRWRVATGGAPSITVRYRVYGREMTVRTNYIEADFALINGAPTFLTLAGETAPRPHEVTLVLPRTWKSSYTGLPAVDGSAHRYRAPDYDTRRLSGIVGIDIRVARLEGKFKLSQNRSAADRAQVVAQLLATERDEDAALAHLMAAAAPPT